MKLLVSSFWAAPFFPAYWALRAHVPVNCECHTISGYACIAPWTTRKKRFTLSGFLLLIAQTDYVAVWKRVWTQHSMSSECETSHTVPCNLHKCTSKYRNLKKTAWTPLSALMSSTATIWRFRFDWTAIELQLQNWFRGNLNLFLDMHQPGDCLWFFLIGSCVPAMPRILLELHFSHERNDTFSGTLPFKQII